MCAFGEPRDVHLYFTGVGFVETNTKVPLTAQHEENEHANMKHADHIWENKEEGRRTEMREE